MYDSCMSTKTITLELDAYEKLKRAKRGRESFSSVVRRARFDEGESAENTGASILREMEEFRRLDRTPPESAFRYWSDSLGTEP